MHKVIKAIHTGLIMGGSHILMIPFPAQGHVIPLMSLARRLVNYGIKVTFVNSDFNHARVMASLSEMGCDHGPIHLVSIPDGLNDEERSDLGCVCKTMPGVMRTYLEELLEKLNRTDADKITYFVADGGLGWALEVAEKMGIPRATFWPASVGLLVTSLYAPKIIEDGIIDENGFPRTQENFKFSPDMFSMSPTELAWTKIGGPITQRIIFEYSMKNSKAIQETKLVLCNTIQGIESPALKLVATAKPIGPLLGHTQANFWPEDSSCLAWLDQQRPSSVIYVAFGSFTIFDPRQFQEIALGLLLSCRPFLWVVRPDLIANDNGSTAMDRNELLAKMAHQGMVVAWSPQQKVLAHPSIACFITHCGWNSTMEGLVNGMPLLCWPYFADQFLNQSYICDVWRVGLKVEADGDGIVRRDEIRKKVDDLLGDDSIKARALELKEMARESVGDGGTSFNNYNDFVEEIKASCIDVSEI